MPVLCNILTPGSFSELVISCEKVSSPLKIPQIELAVKTAIFLSESPGTRSVSEQNINYCYVILSIE